jgi:hypothetical protein
MSATNVFVCKPAEILSLLLIMARLSQAEIILFQNERAMLMHELDELR